GSTFENVCWSPFLRLKLDGASPPPAENEKLVSLGSGLGFVTFLTMIVPCCWVSVKEQVAVSPARTEQSTKVLPSSSVVLVPAQPSASFPSTTLLRSGSRFENVC